MNGLLEKLRRGAIRALGGYVEQVPPPKPQDRVLIKEERYRVRKIEVRAMPFDNGPRAEELLQKFLSMDESQRKQIIQFAAYAAAAGKYAGREFPGCQVFSLDKRTSVCYNTQGQGGQYHETGSLYHVPALRHLRRAADRKAANLF
jgi:hypothetical protein